MAYTVNNLPFTIDNKERWELSMREMGRSPKKDLIESTRFAMENAETYLSIREHRKGFHFEFDGGSASSKDELVEIVRSVYTGESRGMDRLGNMVASAMATLPDCFELTLPCDEGGSLKLQVERGERDPLIAPLDEVVDHTCIDIRRRNTEERRRWKRFGFWNKAKTLYEVPLAFAGKWGSNTIYSLMRPERLPKALFKGDRAIHRDLFEDLTQYSTLDVSYNGESLETGLFKNDMVFQSTYEIGDFTINVGLPLNKENADETLLRNGIPIMRGSGAVYADEMMSGYARINVLIESSAFNTNISGEVIRDGVYEEAQESLKKAITRFNTDYIGGNIKPRKEAEKGSGLSFWRARRFETSLIHSYLQTDNGFRHALRERLTEGELKDDAYRFMERPIFRDIRGNRYSLPQVYEEILSRDFTVYTTTRKIRADHPALDLEPNSLIFRVDNSEEKRFLHDYLHFIKNMGIDMKRVAMEGVDKKNPWRDLDIKGDLDAKIEYHEERMRWDQIQKVRNRQKAIGKGAKVGGVVGATGGTGFGLYAASPYIMTAAGWVASFA